MHAERIHRLHRHRNVGGAFERCGQANFAVLRQKRKGEQQAGDKLGADVSGQGKAAGLQTTLNRQRQTALRPAGNAMLRQQFRVNADGTIRQAAMPGKDGGNTEGGGDWDQEAECRSAFPAVERDGSRRARPGGDGTHAVFKDSPHAECVRGAQRCPDIVGQGERGEDTFRFSR